MPSLLDRIALDQTGLDDKYNFTIEHTPPPVLESPNAQAIVQVLEMHGFTLEA